MLLDKILVSGLQDLEGICGHPMVLNHPFHGGPDLMIRVLRRPDIVSFGQGDESSGFRANTVPRNAEGAQEI